MLVRLLFTPFMIGLLLIKVCNAARPNGVSCHDNLNCESSYCNRKLKCEEQGKVGASCPAGVHEACHSLNCEGGFCVEGSTRVHARNLQEVTTAPGQQVGANVTRAPGPGEPVGANVTRAPGPGEPVGANVTRAPVPGEQVGANVTRSPQGNETTAPSWDGVVTMGNETEPPHNIFNHDDENVTDGFSGTANASVPPRPEEIMDNTTDPSSANASVPPRPSPVDNGNTTNGNTTINDDDGEDMVAGFPCTSDDACGDGKYFCSSLGVCEELNCKNWANHTPAGVDGYSETPCVGEGAQNGTAFCGWDGNCYPYGSCEDWYQFGPVAFTGYDPNNPVEMVCEDYTEGYEENMNSVTFGCRSWQPGNKAPEAISWTHFFNRKCEVTPRNNDIFTCYYNRPGTSFNDYLAAVARLNPPSCDRETYGPLGIEQPIHWYIIQMWQERQGVEEPIRYKWGRENTLSTPSFNPNLAEKTMFSLIVSPDPAPQQTFPDATTPEADSGAATWLVGGLASLWLAASGLLML